MPKQFMPNQHMPLHFIYGLEDCCLCKATLETVTLQQQVQDLLTTTKKLQKEIKSLRKKLHEQAIKNGATQTKTWNY